MGRGGLDACGVIRTQAILSRRRKLLDGAAVTSRQVGFSGELVSYKAGPDKIAAVHACCPVPAEPGGYKAGRISTLPLKVPLSGSR
ncbi:hypothetical protein [Paenibacillus sp. NPDC058177]|uniref:hypothetical protein n=1 Tax=Paenibacillus sp. NPDC058177 TaxID=3346369 RepID=UPI0036DED844